MRGRLWLCILFAAGLVLPAQGAVVHVLTIKGIVNPAMARYIERGIEVADSENSALVVIMLNTPGGLLDSTRDITELLLNSPVPVACYVWPKGAQAASAGTFIVMAAHIAAMAPATNIGAAHPVLLGGSPMFPELTPTPTPPAPAREQPTPQPKGETAAGKAKTLPAQSTATPEPTPGDLGMQTLARKVENDAAAQLRAIAEARGRNVQWAEEAVRRSVSVTAERAVKLNVVDFVAEDLDDLLRKCEGRKVNVPAGEIILHTKDASVRYVPMTFGETFLFYLAHPQVAYILLLLGTLGLIVEVKTPGFGGAGVAGGICLLLALYAMSVLPINYVGLALILLGLGFLLGELYTPTFGLLTLGGAVSLFVGSLMLINSPSLRISLGIIIPTVLSLVAFFVFCLGAVVRSQRRPVVTGREGLVGATAVATTDLNPVGTVKTEGTLFTAEVEGEPVAKGEKVEVVAVNGLRLTVRRLEQQSPQAQQPSR